MRGTRQTGIRLLGVWLVLTGLLYFLSVGIPLMGLLMAVLALAAGLLILVER